MKPWLPAAALLMATTMVGCASGRTELRPSTRAILSPTVLVAVPDLRDGGASDALIGSVGVKTGDDFYIRKDRPKWPSLTTIPIASIAVEAVDTSRLRIGGGDPRVLLARLSRDKQRNAEFRLIFQEIESTRAATEQFNAMLKADPGLASILSGGDTRLVEAVGVAYAFSQDEASQLHGGLGGQLRGDTIGLGVDRSHALSLKVDDGMVLVYRLAKLCWARDGSSVVEIIRDRPSGPRARDIRCPKGSSTKRSPR